MPESAYFKGHGSEVMASMVRKHGAKKGKSVFYATAKKRGMEPGGVGDHMAKMKMAGKFKRSR